ncbi:MAG: transposase zinc-binding domain-containing protein [Gemmatimonadaceae bacterium]
MYEERFAPTHGAWRAVVPEVADKFLACGVLEHGFARVHCDACAHEYLLAFSCKARYFCPSCHAKRLALWTLWLEETLLAPVPHRQVALTIPKRLRTWCLYRRALLGDLARVAARTVTAAVRTLTREPNLAVGVVACIQTHGSLANWHPHIHLLARARHGGLHRSVPPRRAPALRPARDPRGRRGRRHARVAHSGFPCGTSRSLPKAL